MDQFEVNSEFAPCGDCGCDELYDFAASAYSGLLDDGLGVLGNGRKVSVLPVPTPLSSSPVIVADRVQSCSYSTNALSKRSKPDSSAPHAPHELVSQVSRAESFETRQERKQLAVKIRSSGGRVASLINGPCVRSKGIASKARQGYSSSEQSDD